MNFQTIFLQTGFSSIKICVQNIHLLAVMCHSLYSANFSRANNTFPWRMLSFQPQVSSKKVIITKSIEKVILKISQISQESKCWSLFLIKLLAFSALQLYQKETPTLVFSCGICEIFKKTSFEEFSAKDRLLL